MALGFHACVSALCHSSSCIFSVILLHSLCSLCALSVCPRSPQIDLPGVNILVRDFLTAIRSVLMPPPPHPQPASQQAASQPPVELRQSCLSILYSLFSVPDMCGDLYVPDINQLKASLSCESSNEQGICCIVRQCARLWSNVSIMLSRAFVDGTALCSVTMCV